MLPARNTRPGAPWWWCFAALLLTAPLLADEPEHPEADWSHAMAVHRRVERWVKAAKVPAEVEPIRVNGAAGLKITLRWAGTQVGEGQWRTEQAGAVDLINAARLATQAALGEVNRQRQAAASLQVTSVPATSLADATTWLTVDLQIAKLPEPIVVAADAPLDAVYQKFAPGYHGLVLTYDSGERIGRAWQWPGDALARNMSKQVQLNSLLGRVRLMREAVAFVGRPGGVQMSRFEVIHVVRPQRSQPTTRLVRGHVVLPATGLDGPTLEAMGRRLAAHLMRRQRMDGTMAGRFEPTRDQYVTPAAETRDHALAAYALAQWARLQEQIGGEAQMRIDAQAAVGRAVEHLASKLIIPLGDPDTAACSLAMAALIDSPELVDRKALREALRLRLVERQREDGAFRAGKAETSAALPLTDQALPLLALTRLYDQTRDAALIEPIERACGWFDQRGPIGDLAVLTWLGLAVAPLERLDLREPGDEVNLTDRAVVGMMRLQVHAASVQGPADVVGGFNFERIKPYAEPDWRAAHALLLTATLLQRQRVPEEMTEADLLIGGALAGRFLGQLMFDEPGCYYVRSPEDVIGAVRRTLWDNELDVAPTAMALLAVTQFQRALDDLQRRGGVPKD